MTHRIYLYILISLLFTFNFPPLFSQVSENGLKLKMKNVVRGFDKYDTIYIAPDKYDWTLMAQNTNFFQRISMHARRPKGLSNQTLSFSPRPGFKVGPYIGWKWIFLGYTIDVAHPFSAGRTTEFTFSAYANKIGGDIVYLRNKGNFRIARTSGFPGIKRHHFRGTPFKGLNSNTLSINAYYIFNHRHFSYPAAYNQSTRQRLSAGSFILGASFDKHKLDFYYDQLPNELLQTQTPNEHAEDFQFQKLSYKDFCINFGYAYNFVVARNCVLSISFTPAIGYRCESGRKNKNNNIISKAIKYVALDALGRAGFVWNNGHYFAGLNSISHLYGYHNNHLTIANTVNYLNLYAGFYFGLKK